MEQQQQNRGGFASNFGFLMAAVGSAVGLGNIWGFPFKMGKCGGFAFLIVYLCLAVFVGLCVMVGEMALGRKTGQGVVGCYKKLAAKYTWVGWCGIITGFCILCFYLVLGGYVTRYMGLTEEGMQPFHLGEDACVCNGELYLFRPLKAELSKWYDFKSGSDCEIILPLYREYGLEMFKMLDAEFAMAFSCARSTHFTVSTSLACSVSAAGSTSRSMT